VSQFDKNPKRGFLDAEAIGRSALERSGRVRPTRGRINLVSRSNIKKPSIQRIGGFFIFEAED